MNDDSSDNKMIKDPQEVARLARRHEDENWRFRTYLKMLPSDRQRRIDRLAGKLGRQAEAEMDCTACGACCRNICVPLSPDEIERLACRTGMTVEEFELHHLTVDDDGEPSLDGRPCPFLEGNRCRVYEDRPDACRGYPYVGGETAARMIGIIERAGTCPIIFHMLEELKTQSGWRRLKAGSDRPDPPNS